MPIDIQPILDWGGVCAFPSDNPINFCLGEWCYQADCFTRFFIIACILIIIAIAQWQGIKI